MMLMLKASHAGTGCGTFPRPSCNRSCTTRKSSSCCYTPRRRPSTLWSAPFVRFLGATLTPKQPAVHAVADTFLGSAIVFKSDSAALYERFSLPQDQPFLLVFKDFDDSPYNELQLPTGTTPQVLRGRVRSWIRDEKHALVPELGSDNVDDLTRPADRLLLILGVLNADQDRVSAVRMQEEMRQFARRWRNSDEARQVSTHVQWAWINADVSAPWLKVRRPGVAASTVCSQCPQNNYGYVATEQAGLLILDPHRFEYYDRDSRGLPFPWLADGIMRAIVDVEQGKMKAKTSRSYGEKVVHVRSPPLRLCFISRRSVAVARHHGSRPLRARPSPADEDPS